MLTRERVILVASDDEEEEEDDLYKGYNEFHPVLDTRNLQEDEDFKETVHKSSYGRPSVSKHRNNLSTAGVAFNRSTALKSRRTAASRGGTGTGQPGTARPLTAVRGAGYNSGQAARIFDPLGLANAGTDSGKTSGLHLHDENGPEWKIRQLELQINRDLEESVKAAKRKDFGAALDLAKDCVAKERSMNRMKDQSGLMEQLGNNADLTFATIFNLAEQYANSKMWPEAINTYQSIVKNRAFTNTGRLRMNIGEIHFRQGHYPKAIKFYRMALDQIPNTQNELRLKLMQNIGLSFVRLNQFADAIASFEYIISERGEWEVGAVFHLVVCYYALGDSDKMKYYFNKLLQCKVEDQFEERYGHHEILTNGGTIFASPSSPSHEVDSRATRSVTPGEPSSPILMIRDEHDHYQNLLIEAIRNDRLRQYEQAKIRHVEWCILTSAKLISPFIEPEVNLHLTMPEPNLTPIQLNGEPMTLPVQSGAGYDWCLDQIRKMASFTSTTTGSNPYGWGLNFAHLADELELYKAVKHLRSRDFDLAIVTLKNFEKKDKLISARTREGTHSATPTLGQLGSSGSSASASTSARVSATAATNLSFLYLLQQDLESAERYADEALAMNRYCLGALLNKGTLYYHRGEYGKAIDLYQEVMAHNATNFEAYYNLSLAERKLGNFDRALDYLFRLRTILAVPNEKNQNRLHQKISNTIEINLLYQIGSIYESMGNLDQAVDFYQKILHLIPTDVSLLVKMADLAADQSDRKQSHSYLMEAYRYLPSHIPTIERLASYYIEFKMYERAINYLEQLAKIQPNQIKWQLMIAASYRRAGNLQQSFQCYQSIHGHFPENVDCIRFLIRLCAELEAEASQTTGSSKARANYAQMAEQYGEDLRRLEKARELREQQWLQQQTSSRSASRASTGGGFRSASSREGSAATTDSGGSGSSSGYMTSGTTPKKSYPASPFPQTDLSTIAGSGSSGSLKSQQNGISAIVDQVVEQLDNGFNERPTTSWRRRNLKSRGNNDVVDQNGNEFDEDFLIDANIDDILPD